MLALRASRESTESVREASSVDSVKGDSDATLVAPSSPSAEPTVAELGEMPGARGAVATSDMDAVAASEPATIVVRLVGQETGAPLAGQRCFARLKSATRWTIESLDAAEGGVGKVLRSGSDGLVRIIVAPGSYVVSTQDRNESQEVLDLAAGETRELTLAIRTQCDMTAHVLVVDAESEAPLPDIELRLPSLPSLLTDATREARTDLDGRASFRIPSWEPVDGRLDAAGYGPVVFRLGSTFATPEAALVLRLRRSATLRGRVVDDAEVHVVDAVIELQCYSSELGTGDTAMGVNYLEGSLTFGSRQRTWLDTTDAEGNFEIAELPPGVNLRLALRVDEEAVHEESVRLQPGEVRDVVYRLHAAAQLVGLVLDAEGNPSPGVQLWMLPGERSRMLTPWEESTSSTRTTSEGTFEFDDVKPGQWLVGPRRDQGLAPWLTHVDIPVNTPRVDVVLRIPPALYVTGRTLGPAGEPVAGVPVSGTGGMAYARTTTGEDGEFRLGPLREGALTIEASHGPNELVSFEPVEVLAGDSGVIVRLIAGGGLRVRVKDADGRPLPAEILRARTDDPAGLSATAYTSTDSDGESIGRGLPPGLYRVLARVQGGLAGFAGPVRVESGVTAEVEVAVRASGRLRIRTPVSSDVRRVRVHFGGMMVDFERVEAGDVITSKPLPGGVATVELIGPDGSTVTREATVIVGKVVDVSFD